MDSNLIGIHVGASPPPAPAPPPPRNDHSPSSTSSSVASHPAGREVVRTSLRISAIKRLRAWEAEQEQEQNHQGSPVWYTSPAKTNDMMDVLSAGNTPMSPETNSSRRTNGSFAVSGSATPVPANDSHARDPVLGTILYQPAAHAQADLPRLTATDAALVDLHQILFKAGAPKRTFDEMVDFIEKHSSTTFKIGHKIPRRNTFLKSIHDKFPSPPPTSTVISLEADPSDIFVNGHRETVTVHHWDFVETMRETLLDPHLMGNLSNLVVNPADLFGKYVPEEVGPEGENDPELLAARFYQESYDLLITDPETQFLAPILIYMDKTAARGGSQRAYSGEPVTWTLSIFRQELRHLAKAWRVLGYMPDLELSSSAKKKVISGCTAGKGRSVRNYHNCLDVILHSLKSVQPGGFNAWIRLGDDVSYRQIFCPIAVLLGDGKSGDMLALRYGGKNCLRVPRHCLTHFKDLDNMTRGCQIIFMSDTCRLVEKLRDPATLEDQKKQIREELHSLSTHVAKSAFSDACFGSNKGGAITALAVDMMHAFEAGVIKYLNKVFVATLTPTLCSRVDELMEKLFCGHSSTAKKNHLRMNFSGGATSLTLLHAHEWPGMMMGFLVMLLTGEGRSLCQETCFQTEDVVVPEIMESMDDTYPSYTYSNVYIPTSIPPDCEGSSNADSRAVLGPQVADDEHEDSDRSDSDDLTDSSNDDKSVSSTEGTLIQREKKKTTKAEPLNCSYKQFVHLLEELLCFHAWYKYGGSPIGMSTTQETKDHLNRSIRQMMHRMVLFAPRREGHGWKIQKVHDILHLLVHCDHFGSPDNFDCSHNERQLKDFFKIPAQTSQQRGQETFGKQLATNMQEIHLMQKARISLEYDQVAVHPSKTAVATGSTQPNGIWNYGLSVNPACLIQYSRARSSCIFKWLSCGGTPCQIHPVILDWFAKHWADQIGEDLTEVELYTDLFRERNLRGKLLTERFRAHPNFRGEGEVYDYASIVFAEQGMDDHPIPCKLLGFFSICQAHVWG